MKKTPPILSIIIPTFNEQENIKNLLNTLKNHAYDFDNLEIIICDGKSSDHTFSIAQKWASDFSNIRVIESPERGRGKQLNYGSKKAQGTLLYFLHADSIPPKHFDADIWKYYSVFHKKYGCFRMQFDDSHWWLQMAGWFTRFNVKFFRGGDQSLYIDAQIFKELGGFPENQQIFEDYELIRKLYKKRADFVVIPKTLITSARRYRENGVFRLQYHYWNLYLKKWQGASTSTLEGYYKKNIK